MKIEFRKKFQQDLGDINDRKILERIKLIIAEVELAISLTELRNVKAIQGHENYYRIRLGDFRIGLYLEGDIMVFVRILHRKEMYRYFP